MPDCFILKRLKKTLIATINRPKQLNAINKKLLEEVEHFIEIVEMDKSISCVIIVNSGEKAFSIGADTKERQLMNEKDLLNRAAYLRSILTKLENLPIPIIAAINGIVVGEGLELALAADFRICSTLSSFSFSELDMGIIPAGGTIKRLSELVGISKSMELLFILKKISSKEAYKIGLVNKIVEDRHPLDDSIFWANRISECAPIALKETKKLIRSLYAINLETFLTLENEAYKRCVYSKDRLEGFKAFLEKREPIYEGK